MSMKTANDEYIEKAKLLSGDEADRLMARMRGRFERRVEDKRLSRIEALALQLEYEDEGLAQWRERLAELKRLDERG